MGRRWIGPDKGRMARIAYRLELVEPNKLRIRKRKEFIQRMRAHTAGVEDVLRPADAVELATLAESMTETDLDPQLDPPACDTIG